MASVNKVILVGNLGRDPELRYTPGGQAVANFSLATTERFSTRDGDRQERTPSGTGSWPGAAPVSSAPSTCRRAAASTSKGRLQTREWENKEGQKQRTTEIVANTVQFLGGRGGPGGGGGQPGPGPGPESGAGNEGGHGGAPPPDEPPF